MIRSSQIATSIALMLLVFCAQRDNQFDPMSPLYMVKSAELTVALNCDKNKIVSQNGNKFEIISPLDVTFSVDAKQTDKNEPLPVEVKYYIDSELVDSIDNIKNYQKEIVKYGTHEFKFKSSSTDGHETEETYIFQCINLIRPKIDSFFCNHDTLPLIKSVPVTFITQISDSESKLDSIVYLVSDTNNISKKITNSNTFFTDTLNMNLVSEIKAKKRIKVIIYDKLGKADSALLNITFDNNYKYDIGDAPVIDSIQVNKEKIYVGDRIDFEITAHDNDGKIVRYFWTFGDKGSTYSDNPKATYTYYMPGKYFVTVSVTDDSGNTTYDNIAINVLSQPQKSLQILSLNPTPVTGSCPLYVTFKAKVNDTVGVTYKWSFSDWGFSWIDAGADMFHRYDFPGSYTVMLIAKNAQDQDTMSTTITATGPILKISSNKDRVYAGETVHLTAQSSGYEKYMYYNWFFPDTVYNTTSSEMDYVIKKPEDCYVWVMAFNDPFKSARGDILIKVFAGSSPGITQK